LQPTTAGTGKLLFDISTPKGTSQVIVADITVFDDEHEAHDEHEANGVREATTSSYNPMGFRSNGFSVLSSSALTSINAYALATFTKEQSWKVNFATTEALCKPFGQIIRTTAQIQPSQGDERTVTAKTGGIVSITNNNVVEGKAVSEGQILFSIDGSGMADNNLAVRYAEAESEYNRAKVEYDRKQELIMENIISQSDLLKAKTDFAKAEATYNNLRNNFTAGKQNVITPICGFITNVLIRNGEYAEAGQPVLVVSQNRNLYVKAELQPKYFDRLNGIISANIRLLNRDRVFTLEELGGRLLSYSKTTDIANPLITVIFQVNNIAGLLSGSFVEMFIKTQTNVQAVIIPSEAIIEEMGNYFAYVQITPELFEKRPIKKGATDGIYTEITEGMIAGERVVSKGAMFVKLAQAAGALDAHAGHVH